MAAANIFVWRKCLWFHETGFALSCACLCCLLFFLRRICANQSLWTNAAWGRAAAGKLNEKTVALAGKMYDALASDKSLSPDEKRDQVRRAQRLTESQIRFVLTPEQQQEFTQLQGTQMQTGQ